MLTILRRWLSPRQAARGARHQKAFRLSPEELEDRCTPAVLTVNSLPDNTTADSGLTLREAVALVDGTLGRALTPAEQAQVSGTLGANDTIQFSLPAGPQTITLTLGALAITNAVTVSGPGAGNLTVDAQGGDRVFVVGQIFSQDLSLNVSISGLTLTGGRAAYGAGLLNFGTLTLSNDAISNNTATVSGGGGVYNDGALSLSGCTFTNNTTVPGGQGATSGGALLNPGAGTVTGTGCTFTGNTAPGTGASAGQGGALSNSGTMTLDGCTINNNSAAFGGGGVYNSSGLLALTNCTISDNTVTPNAATPPEGGGILNELTAILTLTDCTVSGNSIQGTGQGGGLYNSGGIVTVDGGNFTGNTAASDGGGLYTRNTGVNNLVLIKNATFTNNDCAADGGAVRTDLGGTATVIGCTFVGNTATSEGGAFDASNATRVSITNSTFTGNRAGSIGGALNCGGMGTVDLINDTVTGNRVGGIYGGGLNIRTPGVTLQNTIVAGNYQGSGTTPNDITGYTFANFTGFAEQSSSHNIIGPGGSGGLVNGTNQNQVGVTDLRLGPLADNGGPTQTMALLPGSPAIDRGSNAFVTAGETDQRLLARVVNGTVDIGAFEVQPPPGPTLLVNSTADNTTPDNSLTLREAIAVVDGTLGRALTPGEQAQITGTPGPNDAIRFDLPAGPQTISLTGGALRITRPVAVIGPGSGSLTIDGNNSDRVFVIGPDSSQALGLNVGVSGLTVSGGRATVAGNDSGGGLVNSGTLTLIDVTFDGNTAGSGGGGAISNGGALTVSGCAFNNNAATDGPGGAIQNTSSAVLTVAGCVFTSNTATGGGPGGGIASSGRLSITGSSFVLNRAGANGGGIYNSPGGTLTVNATTVANSIAGADGGGIDNDGAAVVTVSTLSGNFAASEGGGLGNRGTLALSDVTLYGNTATSGGGGLLSSGTATLTRCTITGNRVTQGSHGVFGGGVLAASPVYASYTLVAGNFQGPPPGTTPNDVAGTLIDTTPRRKMGVRLITQKTRKKKTLAVEVFYADTGATKRVFPSPFQNGRYKNIGVSVRDTNGDGVSDEVVVTARKGKRTVTAVFPA
jgi:hypothetical protein